MADEEASGEEDREVRIGYGLCGRVAWPVSAREREEE